jgi:hypothetical protein
MPQLTLFPAGTSPQVPANLLALRFDQPDTHCSQIFGDVVSNNRCGFFVTLTRCNYCSSCSSFNDPAPHLPQMADVTFSHGHAFKLKRPRHDRTRRRPFRAAAGRPQLEPLDHFEDDGADDEIARHVFELVAPGFLRITNAGRQLHCKGLQIDRHGIGPVLVLEFEDQFPQNLLEKPIARTCERDRVHEIGCVAQADMRACSRHLRTSFRG